jgi:hypothetical protein
MAHPIPANAWTGHNSSSPPGAANTGAWTQNSDGTWTWVPGATPDPNLVKQWGTAALTNIAIDPSGNLNHGAWIQNNGWQWVWGANPDPHWVKQYGQAAMTNPNQSPAGGMGPGNKNSPDYPQPSDVVPPTVTDIWNGVAPDVTGKLPPLPNDEQGVAYTEPPIVTTYKVSPGSIRNAESQLLARADITINQYNDLKAYVEQARSQNIYSDSAGASKANLSSTQDHLLLNIGDAIEVCGQFIGMLNYAAQNYAAADIGSFLPES